MSEYKEVKNIEELKLLTGKKVVVVGEVSKAPWQHLMNPPSTHPNEAYFDINGGQIIIYSQEPITEAGKIKVKGSVLEVSGGGKGQKSADKFFEYQIVVDGLEKVN